MTNLPTGTVTFLFTDIEGSTKLAQSHHSAWEGLRARHYVILKSAIESHNGYIFQVIGDAFCAAFHTAADALNAAVQSQVALNKEEWGNTPIKVRMGIHTGRAEVQPAGDYQGYLAMSRVQRLMSAAYGGQVLITLATQQLAREDLPEDVSLRDLGERRLKDLIQPEHVFQLVIPDLPADFPPIKTLDAYRHNLPIQLTSFIGREKEIERIKLAIHEHHLVTLTGSGGTGKTRLSLQVAADLTGQYADGVWFVELASVSDPGLIPQTILSAIGINEQLGRTALQTLIDTFHEKNLLLVLDNCEHLIAATATLADNLLNQAHSLEILATSREALGLKGEAILQVPSLSLPDVRHLPAIEQLTHYEAVQLFIERAMLVQSNFTMTKDNAPAIAQTCSRLDGIPLALELAAARVKVLSVDQIALRLDDRFRLLTGGARTALPRQQTLRATIDWSFNLLSGPERALFRDLTVFSGGWTLEAAETVCQGEGMLDCDVLEALSELVNKSLVVVDTDTGTETRYRFLETIHQYAREKFQETDEVERLHDRHLEYFLALAGRAEPELTGPGLPEWLQRLEVELDNLRAALEWSLKRDAQAGLRLASALLWFWDGAGYLQEGQNWLAQLLSQPETLSPSLNRARALGLQGYLLVWSDSAEEARVILEQSLAMCRDLGYGVGAAFSLLLLGLAISNLEDSRQGRHMVEESLALYRELEDKFGTAWALTYLGGCVGTKASTAEEARLNLEEGLAICRKEEYLAGTIHILVHLGDLALDQMDYRAARRWLEESLAIQRRLGKGGSTVKNLTDLGDLAFQQGDYMEARAYYEESLSVAEETGNLIFASEAPVSLGYVALREGDTTLARNLFEKRLQRFRDTGEKKGIVYTLEGSASLAVAQNHPKQAASVFAWADGRRKTIGRARLAFEQDWVARDLAAIHAQLDEAAFAMAQAEGRAMNLQQIIAYALETTVATGN